MLLRLTRTKITWVLGAAVLVLGGGCTNLRTTASDSHFGIQQFNSRVEYTDNHNDSVPSELNPSELLLVFPYIPGRMYGQPSGDLFLMKHLSGKLDFQLDLRGKYKEIAAFARPMQMQGQGLQIQPRETRMARMGTFAFDPRTMDMIGDGSFIDRQSREYLIMVYVDQPCQITGTVEMHGKVYDHNIRLTEKGFHWIKFRKQGKEGFLLREFSPPDGVNFTVTLEGLLNV